VFSLRGKKAKEIRKEVYGNMDHRIRKYAKDSKGVIRAVGFRRIYQRKKREYKKV
jgi:hypothetical protein